MFMSLNDNAESYIFGIIDILTPYEYVLIYLAPKKYSNTISNDSFTGRESRQSPLRTMRKDSSILSKTQYSTKIDEVGLITLLRLLDSTEYFPYEAV
jgi:hypothetical protein